MFLTKIDRSVVLAGRDFMSRHELLRRLEVIDFGTPPGSVRDTLARRSANRLVNVL
jgi:predicted nicotinamide N-methyase